MEEMKLQRSQLAEKLREDVHSDDITKRLVAAGDGDEDKRQVG